MKKEEIAKKKELQEQQKQEAKAEDLTAAKKGQGEQYDQPNRGEMMDKHAKKEPVVPER